VKTIHVPMEVESVRKYPDGRDGRPVYQVFGWVGDYSVSIHLTEDEANATGLAQQAK
jgi:hypothetical protein